MHAMRFRTAMPVLFLLIALRTTARPAPANNLQIRLRGSDIGLGVEGKYVRSFSGFYAGVAGSVDAEVGFGNPEDRRQSEERYSLGVPLDRKWLAKYGFLEASTGIMVSKWTGDFDENGSSGRSEYSIGVPLELSCGPRIGPIGQGWTAGFLWDSHRSFAYLGFTTWIGW